MLLARTVLHCSVREAQQRIDSREFGEWYAEWLNEPWGDEWRQTASLQATAINLKSKKKVKVQSIIPGLAYQSNQSDDDLKMRMRLGTQLQLRKKTNGDNRTQHHR